MKNWPGFDFGCDLYLGNIDENIWTYSVSKHRTPRFYANRKKPQEDQRKELQIESNPAAPRYVICKLKRLKVEEHSALPKEGFFPMIFLWDIAAFPPCVALFMHFSKGGRVSQITSFSTFRA